MFGYIRPLKSELKIKDYDLFRSAYCGLCSTLRKRYGYPARYLINYDFTFLAMLLRSDDKTCDYMYKRCTASPIRKKRCCVANDSFELCADYSVVLYYWKLRDSVADGGLKEKIKARAALLFLGRAYRKASKTVPEFDEKVRLRLKELSALEKSGCASIDETSDKFADILTAAADTKENEAEKRALKLLLYHIGRSIYIIDAADDIERDLKSGSYNPIAVRFGITDGKISEDIKKEIKTTLSHSAAFASSAFELLTPGMWSPILANIIYLGIPWVTDRVLDSTWRKQRDADDK